MISKVSRPVHIGENPSIAMTIPQEILCEIFSYLEDHPIHFTRVAQVCRTWNFAADNHLFWKRLIKILQLPDPKPKAYKYKTHKSIVLKNWGKFCTLCHVRKSRINGVQTRPVIVDSVKISRIDFKASRSFKVVLREEKNPYARDANNMFAKSKALSSRFLNHLLCCKCHSIYKRYIKAEDIQYRRRNILSVILKEFGLKLPESHARCDRFVIFGEGNPTIIAQELANENLRLNTCSHG